MVSTGSWSLISLQMPCDRIDTFSPSRITLYWKFCRKNVARRACTRSKASINDGMEGTYIVCRLHHLVNKKDQQELGCRSSGWWRNSWWKIACLVALSSIVAYERGWHPETEAVLLEHHMALRQLLLRFWVTDHGDCHFREESLEKVTVVTSKRRESESRTQ